MNSARPYGRSQPRARLLAFICVIVIVAPGTFSSQPLVAGKAGDKKRLLATGKCPGCDLRGAVLVKCKTKPGARPAILRRCGLDLRGALLKKSRLQGAILIGADLKRARLRGADLRGANLSGADLRLADLRGTNLQNANLENAMLQGASIEKANFERANLSGADLAYTNPEGTRFAGARFKKTILPNGKVCTGNCLGK